MAAPSPDHFIVLLVGPKGAGKSHIGTALEELFDIPFLRVEDIWLRLRREKPDADAAAYQREGTRRCLEAVAATLRENRGVVIESTGAQADFSDYLASLRVLARTCLVSVRADPESCKRRVGVRGQSIHVPVSEDRVNEINVRAFALDMEWGMVVMNDPFLSKRQIRDYFDYLLFHLSGK